MILIQFHNFLPRQIMLMFLMICFFVMKPCQGLLSVLSTRHISTPGKIIPTKPALKMELKVHFNFNETTQTQVNTSAKTISQVTPSIPPITVRLRMSDDLLPVINNNDDNDNNTNTENKQNNVKRWVSCSGILIGLIVVLIAVICFLGACNLHLLEFRLKIRHEGQTKAKEDKLNEKITAFAKVSYREARGLEIEARMSGNGSVSLESGTEIEIPLHGSGKANMPKIPNTVTIKINDTKQ